MFKWIKFVITILILAALFVIIAPAEYIEDIPYASDFKVVVEDLGQNALSFSKDLFKNFSGWLDDYVGGLIQNIFDKAEEATQDAAKDALDNVTHKLGFGL